MIDKGRWACYLSGVYLEQANLDGLFQDDIKQLESAIKIATKYKYKDRPYETLYAIGNAEEDLGSSMKTWKTTPIATNTLGSPECTFSRQKIWYFIATRNLEMMRRGQSQSRAGGHSSTLR